MFLRQPCALLWAFCALLLAALPGITQAQAPQSLPPAQGSGAPVLPPIAATRSGATRPPHGDEQRTSPAAQPGSLQGAAPGSALGPLDPAPPPPSVFARPRIGLALGGGGALALSEVGVLQWFEEHRIPVDFIAGTSMGCMIAALYSSGRSPQQLNSVMNDKVFTSVFTFSNAYTSRSFRRRQDARDLPNGITIGLKHRVSFRNSLLIDEGLGEFLQREFVRYDDQTDFNSLPIPLRCIATDLNNAVPVTFSRGSIPDAVRASVSIPAVFQPFRMNGHEYVDGGILENLPTPTVHAMQADVVLAVSLPIQPVGQEDLDSILGVVSRTASVAIEAFERQDRKLADVVIMPDTTGFSQGDYLKTADLALRGYAAAEASKGSLLKYSLGDADWKAYLVHRASLRRGPPASVLRVRVVAPNQSAAIQVEKLFAPLVSQPVDTSRIEGLLNQLRADGRFDATYAVHYESDAATSAEPDLEPQHPVLQVTVQDKPTGPPFLLLGANLEAQAGGITRATVEGILIDQDLGSYGSELRSHVALGYLTNLDTEYFHPLNFLAAADRDETRTFFVAPHAGIRREPFPIFADQDRVADRQFQTVAAGIDLGLTNQRTQEIRAGIDFVHVNWTTIIGSDMQPNLAGNAARAHLTYVRDTQDRALVPQFGARLRADAAFLFDAGSLASAQSLSPSAPIASGQFSLARRFSALAPFVHIDPVSPRGHEILVLSAEGGTMFGRDVAQPFRFTLGGPLRLSASTIDQYRGTSYLLLEPAMLRRIATLPAPLGQNIYLGAAYEFGQIRLPHTADINRQDVYFGLVAETPLGVVTLAPALGTNGERKFIFTLGRLF